MFDGVLAVCVALEGGVDGVESSAGGEGVLSLVLVVSLCIGGAGGRTVFNGHIGGVDVYVCSVFVDI